MFVAEKPQENNFIVYTLHFSHSLANGAFKLVYARN
jgi:hypothetical protein